MIHQMVLTVIGVLRTISVTYLHRPKCKNFGVAIAMKKCLNVVKSSVCALA